ncbi:MAG: DUF427 domain-containing protein [Marinibacterium sp.]|nr:DUF427 domain-containing protein [Marinibacterium sp.]
MTTTVKIRKLPGIWTVRSGGAVVGESRAALELSEGDRAPVVYFPRADIAMAFLERTDKVTHCPHKGDATHYSIVNKSTVTRDAAWSYENPIPAAEEIKGYVAFYPGDSVKVEQL